MRPESRHRGPRRHLAAGVLGSFLVLGSGTAFAQCGPIGTVHATAGGAGISIDRDVTVNGAPVSGTPTGSNDVLQTDGSLDVEALALPDLEPAVFPPNPGTTDLSTRFRSSPVVRTHAGETYYDEVDVQTSDTLIFQGGGTLHVNRLEVSRDATLVLAAGTYFVDEFILDRGTRLDTDGPVVLHIGSSFDVDRQSLINSSGQITDLRVMLHDGAEMTIGRSDNASNPVTGVFRGVVIGPNAGDIELERGVRFEGAILSGGEVDIGREVELTLSPEDAAAIGGLTTCDVPIPLAGWWFDECAYTGAAGEALDSYGQAHARAVLGAATIADGVVSRGLGLDDFGKHLRTSVALPPNWTLSVWMRTPIATSHRYHVLASVDGGGDLMFLDRNRGFRWGVYRPGRIANGSFRFSSLSDGWHHVALVGISGSTRLFVDGRLRDTVSAQATGTLAYLGASFDFVDTNNAQGIGTDLDEMLLFAEALDATEIDELIANQQAGLNHDGSIRSTTACGGLAGFLIDPGGGTASTCFARDVRITAIDGDGDLIPDYAGQVALSVSTGHGAWSAVSATNPVVDTGAANDGAASYGFAPGDNGNIVLGLSNQHAETVTVTVTDAAAGISETSVALVFADNAFVISSEDSFSDPLAGRKHPYRVELFTRDSSSPPLPNAPTAPCAVATDYVGNKILKAWYQATAQHPPTAVAPLLSSSLTPPVVLPSSPPALANFGLQFVDGRADLSLLTSDVGRYSLAVRDDSLGFADDPIDGGSQVLTVRPLGIRISPVTALPSPPVDTPTSGVFAAAGAVFGVTLSAVRWESPADVIDVDGNLVSLDDLLDNTLPTPAFAAATALTANLNTPVGGTAGTLARDGGVLPVGAGEFTAGQAPLADLYYTEVGSMRIAALAAGFLGSGHAVRGISPVLGRFKPDHFELSLVNAPAWQAACTAFTYLGQNLGYQTAPRARLSAHNARHSVTANYDDFTAIGGSDWWPVNDADLDVTLLDPGMPAGITLASVGGAAVGSLETPTGGGLVEFDIDPILVYSKPASATYAGGAGYTPFSAQPTLRLSFANVDGADEGDLSIAAAESIGADQVRHGRLRMDSASGSELLDLVLPLRLETFDGSAWTLATDDTCTGGPGLADFSYTPASRPADAVQSFANGTGGLVYRCGVTPCSVAAGSNPVDVLGDLNDLLGLGNPPQAWLMYDWNGDGTPENPRARASFGVYRGSRRHIYLREAY